MVYFCTRALSVLARVATYYSTNLTRKTRNFSNKHASFLAIALARRGGETATVLQAFNCWMCDPLHSTAFIAQIPGLRFYHNPVRSFVCPLPAARPQALNCNIFSMSEESDQEGARGRIKKHK